MKNAFVADKSFVEYIKKIGFRKIEVTGDKKYYTNTSNGKQIRIDEKIGIITFLSKTGFVVDFSTSYTQKQIDNFVNSD